MAKEQRILDWLSWLPEAALLAVARRLPHRARLGLGAGIGRLATTRLPRLRRRIEANLGHVMPETDPAERAAIARAVGDNFGRTFVEILCNPQFHAARTWIAPEGPGAEAIRAQARAGKGAVLVTGHFGQWEAGRAWMKAEGITCAGVYRPADNPHLNREYLKNLEFGGKPIFEKSRRGVRGMVVHLAKGGILAILTDQYERRAAKFDFVGQPAPTSTVAAELALKFRVPMIPIYGLRAPGGVAVRVLVEDPIPHTDAETMTRAMNASLGAMVRAHPGQYYWLHRRWEKSLPGL
jgi:KDO2-lipid IV(A) lauroyltransferase